MKAFLIKTIVYLVFLFQTSLFFAQKVDNKATCNKVSLLRKNKHIKNYEIRIVKYDSTGFQLINSIFEDNILKLDENLELDKKASLFIVVKKEKLIVSMPFNPNSFYTKIRYFSQSFPRRKIKVVAHYGLDFVNGRTFDSKMLKEEIKRYEHLFN